MQCVIKILCDYINVFFKILCFIYLVLITLSNNYIDFKCSFLEILKKKRKKKMRRRIKKRNLQGRHKN